MIEKILKKIFIIVQASDWIFNSDQLINLKKLSFKSGYDLLFIYIIILSFSILQSYFDLCSKALKIFLIYSRSIESHQLTSIFVNKLFILAFALLPLFLFNAYFYD